MAVYIKVLKRIWKLSYLAGIILFYSCRIHNIVKAFYVQQVNAYNYKWWLSQSSLETPSRQSKDTRISLQKVLSFSYQKTKPIGYWSLNFDEGKCVEIFITISNRAPTHEICQKFNMTGFSGQKFYTLKAIKLQLFSHNRKEWMHQYQWRIEVNVCKNQQIQRKTNYVLKKMVLLEVQVLKASLAPPKSPGAHPRGGQE